MKNDGPNSPLAAAFVEWFGIAGCSARILALLYEAGGEVVTFADFMERLSSTRTATRNAIFRMSEALDRDSIRAVWGRGYRLTFVGLADCESAISDANGRRAAA